MAKRSLKFQSGDMFAIPLADGSFGFGQVIAHEPDALDAALCAIFDGRSTEQRIPFAEAETARHVLAVLFVTSDLIRSRVWPVVGRQAPLNASDYIADLDTRRAARFVGTTVHGSRIITNFVSAYFGLVPWAFYKDPDYFDKLLLRPSMRPQR